MSSAVSKDKILTQSDPKPTSSGKRMRGIEIHSYGVDLEELQHSKNVKKPIIKAPTEVLVKVTASSVNPIDVAMMSKYCF